MARRVTGLGGNCWKRDGSPFAPGPNGYAFIVSSGFLCQEITDELILTGNPRIRYETAPFLKDKLPGMPHGLFAALILGTAAGADGRAGGGFLTQGRPAPRGAFSGIRRRYRSPFGGRDV